MFAQGLLETEHPYAYASRACFGELLSAEGGGAKAVPLVSRIIPSLRAGCDHFRVQLHVTQDRQNNQHLSFCGMHTQIMRHVPVMPDVRLKDAICTPRSHDMDVDIFVMHNVPPGKVTCTSRSHNIYARISIMRHIYQDYATCS